MRMLIDGEWVDAAAVRVDEIRDKATGELIGTAPHGSALDVTEQKTLLMSGAFPA